MTVRAITIATVVLLSLPAAAQIYRCEVDNVAVFSDQPCGPDSAVYEDGEGISFVTPDESLPELAAAARQFVEKRREKLARRKAERQRSSPPMTSTAAPVQQVFVPWPVRAGRASHKRTEPDWKNPERRRPGIADNNRYSPLNGPILGTSSNSAAFAREPEAKRRERRRGRQR